MKTGRVKWFNDKKGYGFIEAEGNEYFAHFSEIQTEGFKTLNQDETVSFNPGISPKGKVAKQICRATN